MQFDIKYAYYNFLQSINYRSSPSPVENGKLYDEIDSSPDDNDSRWVLISQPVIFGYVGGFKQMLETKRKVSQGHVSKHLIETGCGTPPPPLLNPQDAAIAHC